MKFPFCDRYVNLSDKEIVDRIIAEPNDEEAAMYLIYDRYEPLCISVCQKTLVGVCKLDELQSELFMLLKGKNLDWHALRQFQWRSSFGTWLSITAYNLSLELRNQMIENDGQNTSIDEGWDRDEESPKPIVVIPVSEESKHERKEQMQILRKVIDRLENPDHRLVVRMRLYGLSSKETAKVLQAYWDKNHIVKYNKKHELVVPDSGYIDNLFKRGYDKVKKMYNNLTNDGYGDY